MQFSPSMQIAYRLNTQVGSENNACSLSPWKLQQIEGAQSHHLIEKILSWKTIFFSTVSTIRLFISLDALYFVV